MKDINLNQKIIVWDLFGGGQNSVYYSLKNNEVLKNYDIYTFDITAPAHSKQFNINLAQKNIINIFKKYPKPDIIVSSPLCQSFSNILSMPGGGTCFWKIDRTKNKLVFRSTKEFKKLKSGFSRNLDAKTQKFISKLGKKCIDNTIKLIQHYKPKNWYIENPKSSLLWKYIVLNRPDFFNPANCFFNETNYFQYGFLAKKPTYFLSNVKMHLKLGLYQKKYLIKKNENGKKICLLTNNPKVKFKISQSNRTWNHIDVSKIENDINSNSVINLKKVNQKNKLTELQISESSYNSAIPQKLIIHIFKYFNPDIFKNKFQNLPIYIQPSLFQI